MKNLNLLSLLFLNDVFYKTIIDFEQKYPIFYRNIKTPQNKFDSYRFLNFKRIIN